MDFEEYKKNYQKYKEQINVCGGILVSEDKKSVLLIQENCYKWGLPKGKIENTESDEQCAEREIFEETGYRTGDLTGFPQVVVKFPGKSKKGTFFVVEGVNRSTSFNPTVKGEIKRSKWYDLNSVNGPSFTKATCDAIASYRNLVDSKKPKQQPQQPPLPQIKGGKKKKDKDKSKDVPRLIEFNLVPPKVTLDVDDVIGEVLDMYFLN